MEKERYFQQLSDAVVEMEEEKAAAVAIEVVKQDIDAFEAIEKGLSAGMARAGKLYEEEEYFIPELLLCADAMYAGLAVLKPHLKSTGEAKGKIVIGVVEGDTHDIGKNIVKMMLETAGYQLIDLGRDVPPQKFVTAAKAEQAKVIAAATLMSTTMDKMADIIKLLADEGLRDKFKVIVGGGPVSVAFAKKIGADGYAANATDAVLVTKELI
ncbi:MAG TPA: corrinoid protein [Methylomusa anaerophila]|uniref:Methionine synthase n=1 Tax=Methylomusa anaerophila TaxID=1930071 RepID=A0A348AHI9_9FIRM|nr:corrinoid protein [Methylomusa anaerophila]BBB90537.1 methionine synthase [Methylomusa anaerophila]HML89823.1 corrinoid protein [Methylomusa anaerophila]